MLDALQRAVLVLFLVASMAGIGLQVNLRDLGRTFGRTALLLRSLVVNFVVIPALGWLATRTVAMAPASADAVLILACAPGGITAIQFTSKRKEILAFAGQMALLLTGLSIVLSPLLISIAVPADLPLVVPYARGLWYVALMLLLPMGLGVYLREQREGVAQRLAQPVAMLGSLAFLAFVILTLSTRRAAMANIGGGDIEVILGFVVAAMIVGWLAGGPQRETRQVLASASSMRNVALSLAIVTHNFPDAEIEVPLVAFCALMISANLMFLILTVILKRLRK